MQLTKLLQDETGNLNGPIPNNKMEFYIYIKNLPSIKKKLQTQMVHWSIQQRFKEEIIPILQKLFQETEQEGILPNSF